MLEQTIVDNNKVRLNIEYPLMAGIDDAKVPHLLKVNSQGQLIASIGGFPIPEYDDIALDYYGGVPASNDALLYTVTYLRAGNPVAVITITYHGATNNMALVSLTIP